ncbi:MAG: tetratricopeptide repeat protein [Anaerolineales bacterium]|nr:tetratricopeptide repeat protein [Anaerolineales bacterium]
MATGQKSTHRNRGNIKRILCIGALVASMLACNWPGNRSLSDGSPTSPAAESNGDAILPPAPTSPPTITPEPTPTIPPTARIANGDTALENGDWDIARREYGDALQISQDAQIQTAALLGMGKTSYQSNDYQTAEEAFTSLIQNYPQSTDLPYAYFGLGQTYMAMERYGEAADAYLNYMAYHSGIIDAYALNLRGDALKAAGDFVGATNDYRAALQSPGLLDDIEIEIKLAHTHAIAGDYDTAIAMYQDIYNRTASDYTKAQIDLYVGQAYTNLGQMENAYAAYQDAVNNFPTSYDSYSALLTLVEHGQPVNELNRGIVDYYAGQYGVALAALDRYLQSDMTDPGAARYYNGLTYQATGGYEDAIAQWDKIIINFPEDRFWDDAWEQKAYTQWQYLGDYEQAIKTLLDFVSTVPTHERAGEFLYDAAVVAEMDAQLARAAEIWDRVSLEYPGYEKSWRALLLAGVSRYRLGDFANADSSFQRLLANAATLRERSAALLWQGKTQNAMGNTQAAQALWEQCSAVDPTGYYSERARDIVINRQPFAPPNAYDLVIDWDAERRQAEDWLRATFNLTTDTDLSSPAALSNDPRFTRGTELWKLGLCEEARAEFEDLRGAFQDSPVDNYRLTNYLYDLGLYRSAILTARQTLNLAGLDDATSLTAPAYFNHVRFGIYYSDLVIPAAEMYEFHPLFLFSVVRQESAFEGFVYSSAGARGLMQIIPATGLEIASSLGWPENYDDNDLYRPVVSILLGSNYLSKWRDRLGNDFFAALAAYNGGPGNAQAWQEIAGGDPDLFLEIVRFEETRNYIRGVYENFNIYRRIYARNP